MYGLLEIFLNSVTHWPRKSAKLNKFFMGLKMQIWSHADKVSNRIAFRYRFCLLFWHAFMGNMISIDVDLMECFTVLLIVGFS